MKIENFISNAAHLPESVSERTSDPLKLSSPFYIGTNENSKALFVTQMLDSNNYHYWAKPMTRALSIKNKLGFIYGNIKEPIDPNNPLMEH